MTPIVAVSGNHGTKSGPPKIGKELMVERLQDEIHEEHSHDSAWEI